MYSISDKFLVFCDASVFFFAIVFCCYCCLATEFCCWHVLCCCCFGGFATSGDGVMFLRRLKWSKCWRGRECLSYLRDDLPRKLWSCAPVNRSAADATRICEPACALGRLQESQGFQWSHFGFLEHDHTLSIRKSQILYFSLKNKISPDVGLLRSISARARNRNNTCITSLSPKRWDATGPTASSPTLQSTSSRCVLLPYCQTPVSSNQ